MTIKLFNLAFAVFLGLSVTFSLFFVMQLLIASGQEQPRVMDRIRIADITIPEIETLVNRMEPKPEQPEDREQAPDLPEQNFDITAPGSDGLSIGPVNVDLTAIDTSIGVGINDVEMLPIVTAPPQYPARALSRGVEGWVHVRFTVTATGEVINPEVVDHYATDGNHGTFDNSAMRAVMRFKYNARVVDGQAVPVDGVQYVIRFNVAE